jgi:hypothetical protein
VWDAEDDLQAKLYGGLRHSEANASAHPITYHVAMMTTGINFEGGDPTA